jgi:hypothetical protein
VIGPLYGAWWSWSATRSVRRQLRARPVSAVRVGPPALRLRGGDRGVRAVLRRMEPSCLERALVLQAWLRAQGTARAVVIGVTAAEPGFRAHAWIEGEDFAGFTEIARLAP